MRLMSFSLTTDQIRREQKTVTRRAGWRFLKPGDRIQAVTKAMGLKKGETVDRLKVLEVRFVSREPLSRLLLEPSYGRRECVQEGFPHLTAEQFVAMFCASHKGVAPDTVVTRIEFAYVGGPR